MRLIWHGHACFEIVTGDTTVVIDPHDGASIGIRRPEVCADILLITHDHFDHAARGAVKGNYWLVDGPGTWENHVRIKGVHTYHDEFGGRKRGRNTVYVVTAEGISVMHAGDLGHTLGERELKEIGKVDVALVPAGGVFTLDPRDALRTALDVGARVIVPMHYRLPGYKLPVKPVDEFLSHAGDLPVRRVGSEVSITAEALPRGTEIWVMRAP